MVHGIGVFLVGAVGGYWVLERAETHKGGLRKIGRVLGGLIIVISFLGLLFCVWCLATCPPGMGRMCPVSMRGPSSPLPPK